MSIVTKGQQPCPSKGCNSSDAYFEYNDGHGYCFSCKTFFGKRGEDHEHGRLTDTLQLVASRGIPLSAYRKYDVLTKVSGEGEPLEVYFPYGEGSFKIRGFKEKTFHSRGDMTGGKLFGRDKFTAGQSKSITIVEGEYDALAAWEMLGSSWPVVSVRSSSSASKDCEANYDFLNSFERIYICFDADTQGESATKEVARLFDFNKVYHVRLGKHKDANEYLKNGDTNEFKFSWYNAKRFMPKGVISEYSDIEKVLNENSKEALATYPFSSLQDMTYGMRKGETVLITAQEGIGKTEVVRAIEYHVLKTTDVNVGIIHLEEDEKRSVQGLAGYELAMPAHLPDAELAVEDIVSAYKTLTKRDSRVHFYSHFGSDDPDVILDTIRFMASAAKCEIVFLDHITMVVTGSDMDDERRKLDYISTRLAMMTKELNFCLVLVSHVNDDGLTRGSRNISKVCNIRVHLDRDIEAATFENRNKTSLMVRKNRYAGHTGPAGVLMFDQSTFTIKEYDFDEAVKEQLNQLPDF